MAGNNPIYYWDTCIFLAWIRNETTRKPGELEGIHDCLEQLKKRQISLMTSVLTYTEITSLKIPAGVETLFDEVMQRPNCAKIGVDMRVAKLARDLRNYYLAKPDEFQGKTLTAPDAIHLATAILYRASEFHTFDGNNNNKYQSLGLLPLSGNVGGHNLIIRKPPEDKQSSLFAQTGYGDEDEQEAPH
jgi:Predicted nucleic acid-binding protein, contains PIN domain